MSVPNTTQLTQGLSPQEFQQYLAHIKPITEYLEQAELHAKNGLSLTDFIETQTADGSDPGHISDSEAGGVWPDATAEAAGFGGYGLNLPEELKAALEKMDSNLLKFIPRLSKTGLYMA